MKMIGDGSVTARAGHHALKVARRGRGDHYGLRRSACQSSRTSHDRAVYVL